MNTFDYLVTKYKLDIKSSYIEIPNVTRNELAVMIRELGFTEGAEIGVERGIFSEILIKDNPQLHLYSIDAWTAYKGYRDHVSQYKMDDLYAEAKKRLAPYNCTVIKGFSVDVAKTFKDESLDFVYIDGNHEFTQVVNDIAAWERKVKVGGIVAGHDYIKRKDNGYLMHVIPAVHGYMEAYSIAPLFVLGRKHAKSNTDPEFELRDNTRSWFYVKPPKRPIVRGHNQPLT